MQPTHALSFILTLLAAFCLTTCRPEAGTPPKQTSGFFGQVIKAHTVPADSLQPPVVVTAGKPVEGVSKLVRLTNSKVGQTALVPPFQSKLLAVRPVTPGEGDCLPAWVTKANTLSHLASIPEIEEAQIPGSRDLNPHGFIFYGTLQGLKSSHIRCMLQDRIGNVWVSNEEGVTRFDGRYFSHFSLTTDQHKSLIVLCMMEDRSGTLWFGTFGGGLMRYDGERIRQFTDQDGLGNNTVNCLIQDQKGAIWAGTSGGGVARFDGNQFVRYSTKQGLASDQVRALMEDRKGNIWIGTFGNGVSLFDGKRFSNFNQGTGLPATHVSSFYQDNSGNVWIGCFKDGVIRFDGTSFVQYTQKQGLSYQTVLCIMQDNKGMMWFGTAGGGISRLDGNRFVVYNEKDGLPNDYVRCCLVGREGNYWIGTRDGGLVRFNGDLFNHYTELDGLGNSKVLSITGDERGKCWFGSFGGGLSTFDGKQFETYPLNNWSGSNFINAMALGSGNELWLGTDGAGLIKFDGKKLYRYAKSEGVAGDAVKSLLKDRQGRLWIGTYGGGLSCLYQGKFTNYSIKNGLSSDKIMCLTEDGDGKIWIGTEGGGICRWDGKAMSQYSVKEGLPSNSVHSMLADGNGGIWIGTAGNGLALLKGDSIRLFSRKDGLMNDFVTSLLRDRSGNLWIGTRMGPHVLNAVNSRLMKDSTDQMLFRSFGFEDGFIGMGCNTGSIFEDKEGTVWMGSTNRLTSVRLGEYGVGSLKPQVQLISVELFSQPVPWGTINGNRDTTLILANGVKVGNFRFSGISGHYFLPQNLSLPYNHNFLSFRFTGNVLRQPQKIRYQIRLSGVDSHWSSPSDQTEISFGNLKPGVYQFEIVAISVSGLKSDVFRYSFTIRSPWWNTWTFYVTVLLMVVLMIYFFYRIRMHHYEKQKQMLNRIIGEQTSELKLKNSELEAKNQILEITDREKDKLFSIVAHDIRGPLSTFMQITELLVENLDEYSKEELLSIVDNMRRSAAVSYKMLENLLEWARMQRGMIQFAPVPIRLAPFVAEIVAENQPKAEGKSIHIQLSIPEDLCIVGDEHMLLSVIGNLLTNAIKFTPRGGSIGVSAQPARDGKVEMIIWDNGIGMDETMLAGLFRIDAHNCRPGTEGEPSVGLGLILCKEFVIKQEGEIRVESSPGKGTTFHILLRMLP